MTTALAVSPAQQMIASAEGLSATLDIMHKLVEFGCLPKGMKPAEGMLCASMGHKFGWNALEACQRFHVINGTLSMKADVMVGVAKAHPACLYFRIVESTDERCTYETHRQGSPEPERETFTIADAKRAGLMSNKMWSKYPRQMLRARCSAGLARGVYSDILAGIYTPDEKDRPDLELDGNTIEAEFIDAAPRHAAQPGRQRPSNPPRRVEGDASAGGGADAEAQRQATLDEVFAGFKASCDEAGYTIGRGIYCAALGKPAALNDMRAWNNPTKWREEFARMRRVSGSSLPMLVNEAAAHVGMDGARLLAELMAKAETYGEGCGEADRKLAAGLLAERIARKPAETLKALGMEVVK